MFWIIFQIIGFSIFLILTIIFVLKRKAQNLLELYFWGMVFAICYIPIGTNLVPCKIVAMGQLVYMVLHRAENKIEPSVLRYVAFVFFILILFSDIVALVFPPDNHTMLNPVMRLMTQNYTYVTATILLFFCCWCKVGFIGSFLPKYCFIIEVAISIGVIHWLLNCFSIEFMPIIRPDYSMSTDVNAMWGANVVKRVYGFAGEPKNLGFLLVPYIFISLYMFLNKRYRKENKLYHMVFLVLGLWVLLNTYSSSALIGFMITLLIFVFTIKFRINEAIVGIAMIVILAGAVYLVYDAQYSAHFEMNTNSFWNKLNERTFERSRNELENDRQEVMIFKEFKETHHIFHLFGWGIGQYTFYVNGQSNGTWLIPVQSGLILTLVDFGLLGMLLYIFIGGWLMFRVLSLKNTDNWQAKSLFYAALASYIGSVMYGNIVTCWIYLMLAEFSLIECNKLKKIQ